jgi:ABC-2 type transport system ATP-binding protein
LEATARPRRLRSAQAQAAAGRANGGCRRQGAPRVLHDIASDGLTVLVSAHYMDEAERCGRIVYLDGQLVVQGTPDEVANGSGLMTFDATGANLDMAARKLRQMPGVEASAVFGSTLHTAGMDRAALERATKRGANIRHARLERSTLRPIKSSTSAST